MFNTKMQKNRKNQFLARLSTVSGGSGSFGPPVTFCLVPQGLARTAETKMAMAIMPMGPLTMLIENLGDETKLPST